MVSEQTQVISHGDVLGDGVKLPLVKKKNTHFHYNLILLIIYEGVSSRLAVYLRNRQYNKNIY